METEFGIKWVTTDKKRRLVCPVDQTQFSEFTPSRLLLENATRHTDGTLNNLIHIQLHLLAVGSRQVHTKPRGGAFASTQHVGHLEG